MKKIVLLLVIIAGFSACTRNFDEINNNPNDPTDVPRTNLLLTSIFSGVNEQFGTWMNFTGAGLWSQQIAKIQYIDEDKYAYRAAAVDGNWTTMYAGPLYNLEDIINHAGDDEPNMKAAAMVMKAHFMSVVTDLWGDVPFSEALMGSKELTPVYDNQGDVYDGLIAMLGTAAGMFDPAEDDLGPGDIMFSGDVMKWKMLANSLRVKLLVRSSGPNPSALATAAAIIAGEPVFSDNADNAAVSFVGDATYSNPLYENKYVDGRNDHAISKTMTDMMNAGGFSSVMDARLPVYAELNDSGVYRGQPNGSVEPADFGLISQIGAAFRDDPEAAVNIMTYAELKFLQAEANMDKQAYLDAITASHDQYGVNADATYMADAGAAWDANWKKALGEQKWIHLYGNGVEGFAEVRRLDFPVLQEAGQSVYPGQGVPLRFPYPTTELLTNGENLNAAISAQGVDPSGLFARVWWDLQ